MSGPHERIQRHLAAQCDNPYVAALRVVVELHAPQLRFEGSPDMGLECQGCDVEGWDADNPTWPCSTIQAIARELGVETGGDR